MAEELIDRVIKEKDFRRVAKVGPCVTKGIKLVGGDGYHALLYVQLVQKYGISQQIAQHLCHTYGAAAFAVCESAKKNVGKTLYDGYPFIEAEIEYAAKHEYAVTVKDMLTLRMRLASDPVMWHGSLPVPSISAAERTKASASTRVFNKLPSGSLR